MTINDLENMSVAGCDLATYILEIVSTGASQTPKGALVARFDPEKYEAHPNSLIIGIPSSEQSYAHLSYMVNEGQRPCLSPLGVMILSLMHY